jgi:DNA-binding CsgD family transcriptional regulator
VWVELASRIACLEAVLDICLSGGAGALLVGPAGIGKTRLLGEALSRLEARGWHTERFVASEATSEVPFGPLISLLPSGGGDRTQLHASVRQQLRERADDRRCVIGIDDSHLLDPASMACVVDLVHHGDVAVLLTARTGGGLPIGLTRLWTSDALVRVEVGPLDRQETVILAEALLGGRVAPELAALLTELAEGVPLLLRELLIDARVLGAIEQLDGTWVQVGKLSSGARLQELVAARVSQLDARSARLLELVALGEPLRVDLLEPEEASSLDGLEAQGLVQVERSADEWHARVDHPLLGEALRAALATRRRIEVLRDLSGRLVRAGCPSRGDALRVARWTRVTGDELDAGVAIAAGHEALAALDLDLAAELASVALDDRVFEGHLLLGEVRRLQARAAEAEASLALAAQLATDDEQIVRIAMWRSTLLAHHTGEPAAAIRLLEEAAVAVSDPSRALELTSEASFLAGLLGRFDDAVRTNRSILDRPGLDDDTCWTSRINLIYAQVMLGQLDGVVEHVEGALAMVERIETVRPEGVDLLWALRTGIAVQRGALVDGEREVLAHIARCEELGAIFGLTAAILQQLMLVRGSPELLPLAERALRDLDASDPYAVRSIALACTTLSLAAVGEAEQARCTFDSIPDSALDDVRAVAFVGRARAAVRAYDDLDDGAALAAASGRESIERLHVSFGALALYDAALMGRPELVADELAEVASTSRAPLFVAMSDHATAARAGNADALERVATTFAHMGARPLAAAAFADAARAHDGVIDARRAAVRSRQWARAASPMVRASVEIEGAVSDRELDVALEAATGSPSREIGEHLFLSVRTVDNHLRHVYSKLGLSGRDDLRQVLEPIAK